MQTVALPLAEQIAQTHHALTADEVGRLLHLSKVTIFRLARAGRIPTLRIGASVRFDPCAVAKWLRERSSGK